MSADNEHASLLASVATAAATASTAAAAAPLLAAAAAPAPAPAAAAPVAPAAAAQPEGLTAAAALELVATGYPAFAGKLGPLITLAKNGTTEAAFSRAIVADLAAPSTTTASTSAVDNRRENTQIAPNGDGPKAEAPDRGAVFAGRAQAMTGGR